MPEEEEMRVPSHFKRILPQYVSWSSLEHRSCVHISVIVVDVTFIFTWRLLNDAAVC